jgi:hypothetical protein
MQLAFSFDREALGRLVHSEWIAWAKEQPHPKSSWLQPWEALDEPDQEVDCLIGETVAREATKLVMEYAVQQAIQLREREKDITYLMTVLKGHSDAIILLNEKINAAHPNT